MEQQDQTLNSYEGQGGFSLGKKWFWVGVILALNTYAGLVYGVALILEPKHRKEGLIILAITVVWTWVGFQFIGPWLQEMGYLPKSPKQLIPLK